MTTSISHSRSHSSKLQSLRTLPKGALLACTLAFAIGTDASAQNLKLPAKARGTGILKALGNNLATVAADHGRTTEELSKLCMQEKDIWVDENAKLFYACQGPVAAGTPTNAGTDALQTYPSSQTFLLHSRPGATRIIYLDFNGHTTTGTNWNSAFTAGAAINSPSFDTDGNATVFSAGEMGAIQQVWQQVSEDYAAWDVDVTTAEPPLESLRKTSATDTAYGVRVVIGGSSNTWFGSPAGGVAYIGSYSWNTDTPVFIFPTELANGYAKYVAEATSHEVGHSVGLNHDGQTTGVEYYAGHAGWAPIMGNSYSATISQFSKGEYANPSNTQDDLTVVNSHIPRTADLAGNDILTAVPLSGTSLSATGNIESASDADLYKVVAGAGTLSLTVATASPDANLDVSLSLYNGSGNLLLSANPTTQGATLSTTVATGTYYIAVEGVGSGTGSTGYTDYASIGQFSLTGTVPAAANQPPVAVVGSNVTTAAAPATISFNSTGSYDPEGGTLNYDWDFGNGTTSTLANPTASYTTAGTYVASLVVFDSTGLSASATRTITVTAPVASAKHYVSRLTITKEVHVSKGTRAKVVVTMRDQNGALKPNVRVTGSWTGLTTATTTLTTTSTGTATYTSAYSKNAGSFTFNVTGASLTGSTYTPSMNVQSSISVMK